jgi:hypothetical protein
MKKCRKTYLPIVVIILLAVFNYNAHAEIKSVNYGVDINYAPFSYETNSTPQGFETELVKLIFKPNDYILKPVLNYSWDEIYKDTKNNKLEICSALVKTPQREKDILFTDTVYTRYYGVFTNSSSGKLDVNNMKLKATIVRLL